MQYIIVNPTGVITSAERAAAISRELYCVSTPRVIQTPEQAERRTFDIVTHPDGLQHALVVDTLRVIRVHHLATLERLVALLSDIDEAERMNLQAFIFSREAFEFGEIIPTTTAVRSFDEMLTLGWFVTAGP